MTQLILPFPEFRVPADHLDWLRDANAIDFSEKHDWFYPFKRRFLHAHGIPDGHDVQIIKRECWTCEGTGIWESDCGRHSDVCERCWGTGVHREDTIKLSRWMIRGHVFHLPEGRDLPTDGAKNVISGLIKHNAEAPSHIGHAAFSQLLLRYEPRTWWQLQRRLIRRWWRELYHWRLKPRWARLMFELQEHMNGEEDVPF